MSAGTPIPPEFANWLLTRFAAEVIDAVKAPGEEADELLRTINRLPQAWIDLLEATIKELPR